MLRPGRVKNRLLVNSLTDNTDPCQDEFLSHTPTKEKDWTDYYASDYFFRSSLRDRLLLVL